MAEAEDNYLYSVKGEENERLKATAREIGAPIRFDKEHGAYILQTDGKSTEELATFRQGLAAYIGDEAKGRWQADRDARAAEGEALRSEARKREATTREPRQHAKAEETGIKMYPAHSQKAEFRKLVQETGSSAPFIKGKGDELPFYRVTTAVPERFADYVGKAAMDRYVAEHAARGGKEDNQQGINTATERARDEARQRGGSAAFMVQYKDRGFRLADPENSRDNHQKQLNEMRAATRPQLLAVAGATRSQFEALQAKELGLRSSASGLSVDQLKAMSFADQKAAAPGVGLKDEDFMLNAQLARGLAAINAELRGRGGVVQKPERVQNREQTQERGQETGRATSRGVSSEQAADNELDVLAAAAAQRGGRGR
ncbi:hypothetical protein [Sphingosinicella sp. BN140058]|uniref:hypothetical protein n=1 Tax=Sphingosinicella sp. BN140058 TaxID=1892855 RepID=UPI0010110FFD|nr:hypothetical protein [Sphingosinicella sp. BN140058]QAY80209.1 hypothetical protein ETR14_26565 [Sphingosinicella sp. BN140058]